VGKVDEADAWLKLRMKRVEKAQARDSEIERADGAGVSLQGGNRSSE